MDVIGDEHHSSKHSGAGHEEALQTHRPRRAHTATIPLRATPSGTPQQAPIRTSDLRSEAAPRGIPRGRYLLFRRCCDPAKAAGPEAPNKHRHDDRRRSRCEEGPPPSKCPPRPLPSTRPPALALSSSSPTGTPAQAHRVHDVHESLPPTMKPRTTTTSTNTTTNTTRAVRIPLCSHRVHHDIDPAHPSIPSLS